MGKHVIFLGAGASYTSGYPLAADLRLIIASKDTFETYVNERLQGDGFKEARNAICQSYADSKIAVDFFKEGCFATVDEFSYVASQAKEKERFASHARAIRRLMTLVIAIHCPDAGYKLDGKATDGFQSSDYIGFIQKLFRSDALHDLRDDTSVLSFNYDPYLEYLLCSAFSRRRHVAGAHSGGAAAIQSGFGELSFESLHNGTGFALLKLHGTAVPAKAPEFGHKISDDTRLTFDNVFWRRNELLNGLLRGVWQDSPIFFPWELLEVDGGFTNTKRFEPHEAISGYGARRIAGVDGSLYSLCAAIWDRAAKEVSAATKVSFVGISFHQLLTPGFQRLFRSRAKNGQSPAEKPEVVFANKEFARDSTALRRAQRYLQGVWSEYNPDLNEHQRRVKDSFATFVREELG